MEEFLYKDEGYQILGACFDVYTELISLIIQKSSMNGSHYTEPQDALQITMRPHHPFSAYSACSAV